MEIPLLHCTKENKLYFQSISRGLEPLKTSTSEVRNYRTRHIVTLTDLLHLNVSRHNWSLAYKIFATLIRIPGVQIKSLGALALKYWIIYQIHQVVLTSYNGCVKSIRQSQDLFRTSITVPLSLLFKPVLEHILRNLLSRTFGLL